MCSMHMFRLYLVAFATSKETKCQDSKGKRVKADEKPPSKATDAQDVPTAAPDSPWTYRPKYASPAWSYHPREQHA